MPPKVQIPIHVFVFGVASIPGVAYALYWKRNHPSEDDFQEKLQENYKSKIQSSMDKKQDMVNFFQAMKDPKVNPEQDRKMMQVLHGGRGDIKRHYAVDEKLYGTEEGVMKKKEAEEVLLQDAEGKKKKKLKKNKKRKKEKATEEDVSKKENASEEEKNENNSETKTDINLRSLPYAQQAAISALAIGSLAAVANLLSGKRGS